MRHENHYLTDTGGIKIIIIIQFCLINCVYIYLTPGSTVKSNTIVSSLLLIQPCCH